MRGRGRKGGGIGKENSQTFRRVLKTAVSNSTKKLRLQKKVLKGGSVNGDVGVPKERGQKVR